MNIRNNIKIISLTMLFAIAALCFSIVQSYAFHAQSDGKVGTGVIVGASDTYFPIIIDSKDEAGTAAGCEQIQEAIDNIPETGGKVILASGVFTCTSAIVIDRNKINLEGQGESTILRLADKSNIQ